MISEPVNLSTGPVGITAEVQRALAMPSISHRSTAFIKQYQQTVEMLCAAFNVNDAFILTGSGTMANEAMLWQIKALNKKGLILSNGEFGSRLISQSKRLEISYVEYILPWGEQFNPDVIENLIIQNNLSWILFCHCETSTGVINDLQAIAGMAHRYNIRCFADCMSTVGTQSLDLDHVSMATASSGKGLASVPGLAIVLSNIQPLESDHIPSYADLHSYSKKGGIPFTISSALVNALHTSIAQKLVPQQFELASAYSEKIFELLNSRGMVPFSNASTRVFTIVSSIASELQKRQLILSHESEYLRKRNWCQLALLGVYTEQQLKHTTKILQITQSWYISV